MQALNWTNLFHIFFSYCIKFRGFRGFWTNPRKLVTAKNPNSFIRKIKFPRNFQIMLIREMKFFFSFEKRYLFFKTILIDSESNYECNHRNIFTVLEDG